MNKWYVLTIVCAFTVLSNFLFPQIGNAASWYDTDDIANIDTNIDQSDSSYVIVDNSGLLVLPAGTVSKLRVYTVTNTFG